MSIFDKIKNLFSMQTAVSLLPEDPPISTNNLSDLDNLKLSELRAVAKERGMKGYTKLRKAELLALLKEN